MCVTLNCLACPVFKISIVMTLSLQTNKYFHIFQNWLYYGRWPPSVQVPSHHRPSSFIKGFLCRSPLCLILLLPLYGTAHKIWVRAKSLSELPFQKYWEPFSPLNTLCLDSRFVKLCDFSLFLCNGSFDTAWFSTTNVGRSFSLVLQSSNFLVTID